MIDGNLKLRAYLKASYSKLLLGGILILVLNACGSIKAYNGPTRPRNELAFIGRDAFFEWIGDNDQSIEMIEVNGFPIRKSKVWIEPGPCTVKVEFSDDHDGDHLFSRSPAVITFQAQAGESYYLASSVDYEKKTWSIWIDNGWTKDAKGNDRPRIVSETVTSPYAVKWKPQR